MRIKLFFLMLVCLVVSVCSQVRAATLIPFQFRDGLVWVKVSVPGHSAPLNFLLDSGAGISVLHSGTAKKLGLKLGAAESVQGVNGSVSSHRIDRFTGNIAGIPVPRRVLALDLSGVSAVCHQRIDGLLGADFFRGRIVQVDFAAERLRLLSRGEANAAGGESLPLVRRGDALCTRISVAGRPADWVRVDTGCDSALRWVASPSVAASMRRSSIGIAVQSPRYLTTNVQLGSLQFGGVKTGIHSKQIFPGEAGLLGNGLLSRFKVTFDVPGKRLLLQPR